MKHPVGKLVLPLLLGAVAVQAYLPYPERQLKYPRIPAWDAKITTIWGGWKSRFISGGLVQANDPQGVKRPVSEGQSYALMLAVWMGDQATFNTVWTATENSFWNSSSGWYRWATADANFAGDADIDICGALIFASALVDSGYWTNTTVGGNTYKAKAKIVLNSIMTNFIDKNANYRINSWPGAGDGIRNPSYHMPQWYPIFKEFAAANGMTSFDWDKATTGAYDLIEAQTNSAWGMARNFSSGSGGEPSGGTSSPNNKDMGFDAIRVPYRMGMAAIWYNQARAQTWTNRVWTAGKVDPTSPGMYTVSSGALWGWTDAQYEKFMSRTMWGVAAVAAQDQSAASLAARNAIVSSLANSLTGNSYLDGENLDTVASTAPAKNYFAQSLGLLGVVAMSGHAWNVWDDLKHTWVVPDTGAKVLTALSATPNSIPVAVAGNIQTSRVYVKLSKSIKWSLRLRGRTSLAQYDTSGISDSLVLLWSSNRRNPGTTAKFVAESVDVRLFYAGGDSTRASQNTLITVTPSVGVGPRAIRGTGLVRAVEGGWSIQDSKLSEGLWDHATLRDLQGREVSSVDLGLVDASSASVFVPGSARGRTLVMEIRSASGQPSLRYIVSPVR